MTIFVVLETTGGWSGTEPYRTINRAFKTKEEARAYILEQSTPTRQHRDLFDGEVFEVEFEP